MTNHVARLYAVALSLVVFFLSWAVVSARPWAVHPAPGKDSRLVALERREARLQTESVRVRRIVKRRFHRYEARLRARRRRIAAIRAANAQAAARAVSARISSASSAPSVGVVSLPPVTSTKTS